MRFKVDENLPLDMESLLREAGHDAEHVITEGISGRSDTHVAAVCQAEQRVLITLDMHFSDIRSYPPREHCGIIVLRLSSSDRATTLAAARRILPLLGTHQVSERLWIVEDLRVRVRGAPSE